MVEDEDAGRKIVLTVPAVMTKLATMFLVTISGSVNWLITDGKLISSSGRMSALSNVRKYKPTRKTSITTNWGDDGRCESTQHCFIMGFPQPSRTRESRNLGNIPSREKL